MLHLINYPNFNTNSYTIAIEEVQVTIFCNINISWFLTIKTKKLIWPYLRIFLIKIFARLT